MTTLTNAAVLTAARNVRDWQALTPDWVTDAIVRATTNVVAARRDGADLADPASLPPYAHKHVAAAVRTAQAVADRQARLIARHTPTNQRRY
jgi:hypothetical protein